MEAVAARIVCCIIATLLGYPRAVQGPVST
jgi:hypothetical protein